jgi:thiamine-phosphate pyrophosphorylase
MAPRCLLCYITDRRAFPGDETSRRRQLKHKIADAARQGIDYIQLREKDLTARDLETLARESMQIIEGQKKIAPIGRPQATALLINSRVDIALAANANGVHLRSADISPQEVRTIWQEARGRGLPGGEPSPTPLIAVSCHSVQEVNEAAANAAAIVTFAPVFEKRDSPEIAPAGLKALRQACHANISVLALGGITMQNAQSCLEAGASGIAAIRLFQENDVGMIVRALRGE